MSLPECLTNLSTIFCDLLSPGGKAFLKLLLPRLNPRNINGGPAMPFQLEVMDISNNPFAFWK